jgi:hypothetical protein
MAKPIMSSQKEDVLSVFIPEIFDLIAKELTQFDLVSLSRTCSALHSLANSILYRSINIDCNFSQFEKEYFCKWTTFIRTKANFNCFIRSVGSSKSEESKWTLIKEFEVVNLPLDFYDFEMFLLGLNDDMISFFKRARLNVLSFNHPLSFNVLKHILNDKYSRENLSVLEFDLNVHAPIKSFYDIFEDTEMRFRNLSTLSVNHIRRDFNITDILHLIQGENVDKLENLELAFQHKTFKLTDLLDLGSKLKSNNVLFNQISKFRNLKSLSLRSITIDQTALQHSDAETVAALQNLTHLELCDVRVVNPSPLESIVHTFYKTFPSCNLKHLKFDIRSTSDDHIPDFFLTKVPANQIKELDIIIRYNSMYLMSLDELINNYLRMILHHRSSLKKLSLEIKSEKNLINMDEQLHKEQLLDLITHRFERLESFRIQVHADCVIMYKDMLFNNMPRLKNFWIVGSNAVPIHFGSGNMYPGIYDKWWRLIFLPEALTKGLSDHPLRYIKIDECLYLINPKEQERVQPKDSIDRLFDYMTRVSLIHGIHY